MKEVISAVLLVVSLLWGAEALQNVLTQVKKAALVKAASGIPSLAEMNKKISGKE